MIRQLLILSLTLSGCAYHPPAPGPSPKPDPTPANVSAVERAANESFTAYRTELANVAAGLRAELKTKAPPYKDAAEFFADWEKQNKAAREKALTPYAEAVNAELFERKPDGSWKTDGPIDAAEFDRVLMEAGRGLRGN